MNMFAVFRFGANTKIVTFSSLTPMKIKKLSHEKDHVELKGKSRISSILQRI